MTIGEYIAYGIQIVFGIGFVWLLVLKIKERIQERKKERYKEVKK